MKKKPRAKEKFRTPTLPKVGDKIYVPTSLYVYRGADDFMGGVATISKVEKSEVLPPAHFNYLMVGIEERKQTMYNYKVLMERQSELKKQFGKNKCYPDPDLTPSMNDDNEGWKRNR